MIVKELEKLAADLKKAVVPITDFIGKYRDDPFFETKNGRDVMTHLSDLMMDNFLLNMKMAIIKLEDISLELKLQAEEEKKNNGSGSPQEKQSP